MNIEEKEQLLKADIEAVRKIPIVENILNVICQTTGMGFAAIARVTESRWITCSVKDDINFGLKVGDELQVETTICHQIRLSNAPVIIDDVDKDSIFSTHHTPRTYGFKSYISVPIIKKDGTFFGTLCAIDPSPKRVSQKSVVDMFYLFSDLISFHLSALEQLEQNEHILLHEREERQKALEQKNVELEKMNMELEAFAHVASHDLQEPLRKIQTFSQFIKRKDYDHLSDDGKNYFDRLSKAVVRMQTLIKDLLMYTQVKMHEQSFELIPLNDLVNEVVQNYAEDISQKGVQIQVGHMCSAPVIRFQFNQLLQNLIGNSIKFMRPDEAPLINISSTIEPGAAIGSEELRPEKNYCHLIISDNGIGFDPQHRDRIFKMFQRLNGREEYDGTGIGLSIVKKIVDNHHGFITASGEVNVGARFDIYLPQDC